MGLPLSLRLESADLGVRVSAVCPGYVRTNIYQNTVLAGLPRDQAARKPVQMIEAAQAAVMILDGVARNHALILFPRLRALGLARIPHLPPRHRADLPHPGKATTQIPDNLKRDTSMSTPKMSP